MNAGWVSTRAVSRVSATLGALVAAMLFFLGGVALAQGAPSTTVPATIPPDPGAGGPTGNTGASASIGTSRSTANSGAASTAVAESGTTGAATNVTDAASVGG